MEPLNELSPRINATYPSSISSSNNLSRRQKKNLRRRQTQKESGKNLNTQLIRNKKRAAKNFHTAISEAKSFQKIVNSSLNTLKEKSIVNASHVKQKVTDIVGARHDFKHFLSKAHTHMLHAEKVDQQRKGAEYPEIDRIAVNEKLHRLVLPK